MTEDTSAKPEAELKQFAIRYIYKTVNKNGKKKNRFGSEIVELDATPADLIRSKKLHIYLGQASKIPKGHKALSVQITDITEIKENDTESKKSDDSQKKVDRSAENESGEI
ncbi:MAG: hypothetical protein GY834_07930, partial [Bacteroidetes bacterium]|nr:hypothetical protein [Bacteroidota bacterium]